MFKSLDELVKILKSFPIDALPLGDLFGVKNEPMVRIGSLTQEEVRTNRELQIRLRELDRMTEQALGVKMEVDGRKRQFNAKLADRYGVGTKDIEVGLDNQVRIPKSLADQIGISYEIES